MGPATRSTARSATRSAALCPAPQRGARSPEATRSPSAAAGALQPSRLFMRPPSSRCRRSRPEKGLAPHSTSMLVTISSINALCQTTHMWCHISQCAPMPTPAFPRGRVAARRQRRARRSRGDRGAVTVLESPGGHLDVAEDGRLGALQLGRDSLFKDHDRRRPARTRGLSRLPSRYSLSSFASG
jgi:hypothetical protein